MEARGDVTTSTGAATMTYLTRLPTVKGSDIMYPRQRPACGKGQEWELSE